MRITPEVNKRRVQVDGTCAVRLIIWINNTRSTKAMGFTVEPHKWDDRAGRVALAHKMQAEYNARIYAAIAQADAYAAANPLATAKEVCEAISQGPRGDLMIDALRTVASTHTERFKPGTQQVFNSTNAQLAIALPTVRMGELATTHVQHFHRYLIAYRKPNGKPLMGNTIRTRLRMFRIQYNQACEDLKLPPTKAFRRQIPKELPTEERHLTENELNRLIALATPTARLALTKHTHILQIFLGGMRISDVLTLRHDHFRSVGTHLELNYSMEKTDERAWVKVPPQAVEVIEHYRTAGWPYVLPSLKRKRGEGLLKVASVTAVTNQDLKVLAQLARIPIELSTHCARHTFGAWAYRMGIPLKTLQMIFRHKDIKTTMRYMARFDKDKVGKAFDQLGESMPASVL